MRRNESFQQAPAPYQSAVTIPLDKEVNLVQLADEIGAATKRIVHLAISTTPGADGTLTSMLSVSPGSVAVDRVAAVVAAHQPVPDYGVPAAELAFRAVVARAQEENNPELNADELQTAVLGLLRRVASN